MADSEEARSTPGRGPRRASSSPRVPFIFRLTPFFVSGVFFLSVVFSVFSPFPLLLYSLQNSPLLLLTAILSNVALVGFLGGWFSALIYLTIVGGIAFFLPHFLIQRRLTVNKTVGSTLGLVMFFGCALVFLFWKFGSFHPFTEVKGQIAEFFNQLQVFYQRLGDEVLKDLPFEEFRRTVLVELPSTTAIFALVMICVNLVMLLNLNPRGLRQYLGVEEGFFRRWKAPEWLVWGAVGSLAALIFAAPGPLKDVSSNVFNVLKAVYAIQGVSILSFLFDHWKLQGFFKTVLYVVLIVFMQPFVIGMGFFDLWFDFRGKLRQS